MKKNLPGSNAWEVFLIYTACWIWWARGVVYNDIMSKGGLS